MKPASLIAFAGLALAFAAPAAAAPERPATVAEAAADDKAAKGEERDTTRPRTPQQEKMKTCNAEAKVKDLHGDERRAFMSTCLKG